MLECGCLSLAVTLTCLPEFNNFHCLLPLLLLMELLVFAVALLASWQLLLCFVYEALQRVMGIITTNTRAGRTTITHNSVCFVKQIYKHILIHTYANAYINLYKRCIHLPSRLCKANAFSALPVELSSTRLRSVVHSHTHTHTNSQIENHI